ncbi:MAG TPA: PorP/SprF family type IX secretion system membrane protein [Bacteroidales bacterium]|nr:PorP/SprF family type IX secretion system membrane protein [Bacteroidales bacterium]
MSCKKKITKLVGLALIVMFSLQGKAQETVFSQYYNNPVLYNPGLIGADLGMKVRFQYRDQWSNLPGNFNTINFNMDIAERNIPGSGGLAVMFNRKQEGQGFLEKTVLGIGTSVRIPLQENIVTHLGFMGSFVEQKVNWSNLVFSDQFDQRYGDVFPTAFTPPATGQGAVRYPDIVIGNIIRFFPYAYSVDKIIGTLGFAVHHALEPEDSYLGLESKVPRKYVAHGNMMWINQQAGNSRNSEGFSGITKYDFGFLFESWQKRSNYAVGVNVMRSNLYLGTWFRGESYGELSSNAVVFMLGLNYTMADNATMKIMYSYDWDLNELVSISGPTHELTLIFQMDDVMMFGKSDNFRDRGYSGGSFGNRNSGGIIQQPLECSPF